MQGDIVGILDTTGNTVVKYTYDIWGKLLSITGMLSSTVGAVNPLRYRGYYYDTETGLYYLQSRYYSPDLMRFISQDDPALSNAQGEPLGSNLYVYCLNNPVMNSDPNGFYYIRISKIAKILTYIIGFNPVGATLLCIGYYRLKRLIVVKMAIIGAKLGSFYVPLKLAFGILFGVLGLSIGASIASALWECANTGKKGIEFVIRKDRWGIPYKLDIYAR